MAVVRCAMEAFLTNVWGGQYKLPLLLEWNFSYGAALPCGVMDSAAVSLPSLSVA